MMNYRVQSCLDSTTYNALEKYMKKNGYETVSVAVRKIICAAVLGEVYENAVEEGTLKRL